MDCNKIIYKYTLIDKFIHSDENNNNPLQRESKLKINFLFQGSPTYLLINNDVNSIPQTCTKISFRLFTFKKLESMQMRSMHMPPQLVVRC